MSKIKSQGAAKLKLLLVVPKAAFLLLAFAEPKADAIRAKMEKIADPKEKSELKAALVEVMKKQEKIESWRMVRMDQTESILKSMI